MNVQPHYNQINQPVKKEAFVLVQKKHKNEKLPLVEIILNSDQH